MDGTKSPWASRGLWGAGVAIAAGVAGLFGYSVDGGMQADLLQLAEAGSALAGGVLAFWGRFKATKTLG
ncbi:hypothetical protein HDIA_1353 [Hartmannibacter diazotrophicus]|uniref:Uncharacterized protein n=2 Tax=Hartmannibacter diazotrophicus TaxID=1482074 RepID=A0A2C9D3P6_9HYPH|nr:hypothetical protein HDIA_1353 [Hartmannibacter diazotrophicus]